MVVGEHAGVRISVKCEEGHHLHLQKELSTNQIPAILSAPILSQSCWWALGPVCQLYPAHTGGGLERTP